MVRMLRAA